MFERDEGPIKALEDFEELECESCVICSGCTKVCAEASDCERTDCPCSEVINLL